MNFYLICICQSAWIFVAWKQCADRPEGKAAPTDCLLSPDLGDYVSNRGEAGTCLKRS